MSSNWGTPRGRTSGSRVLSVGHGELGLRRILSSARPLHSARGRRRGVQQLGRISGGRVLRRRARAHHECTQGRERSEGAQQQLRRRGGAVYGVLGRPDELPLHRGAEPRVLHRPSGHARYGRLPRRDAEVPGDGRIRELRPVHGRGSPHGVELLRSDSSSSSPSAAASAASSRRGGRFVGRTGRDRGWIGVHPGPGVDGSSRRR